jgi:Ca2+-binding RTX toxin-like protein
MGTGDDTFTWDPGDGSDTIDGQAGNDTMRFNGAAGAEKIVLSANGSANDRLEVSTLTGTDAVTSAGLVPGSIQLVVNGVPVP